MTSGAVDEVVGWGDEHSFRTVAAMLSKSASHVCSPARLSNSGACAAHHCGNACHIGILAPKIDIVGHRTGNEPCILTAEEHAEEIFVRIGNNRNTLPTLETQGLETLAGRDRLLSEARIGKNAFESPAR